MSEKNHRKFHSKKMGRHKYQNNKGECHNCHQMGHFARDCTNPKKVDSEWMKPETLDLKFEHYVGEKLNELPKEFLKTLNEDQSRAESKEFFKEKDFEITQYLSQCAGFSGILKHRSSDFVVHEIDKTGKIIRLTDFEVPKVIKQNNEYTKVPDFKDLEGNEKKLTTQLSWSRLTQLAKKGIDALADEEKKDAIAELGDVKIEVTDKDKDERKAYHMLVKKYFPILDTNTVGEEKKYIRAFLKKRQNDNQWPRDRPKHLTFHLCKQELDSHTIFAMLGRLIAKEPSKFKVAGTKDKRAISTQKVCIPFVNAEKLKTASKGMKRNWRRSGERAYVGNFSYEKESLELGDLQGNHFSIVLRDIKDSKETIDQAMNSLKNGFINYFGHQRFGTDSTVKTSDIGLALVKNQWESAVELILKPRPNETHQLTRMRAHWWMYRKPSDAVVLLGNRMSQARSIEATLLQGLARVKENDFVNGIGHLQRNIQSMYVHAYQSLVWNKVVSERIKRFGDKVLIGDFVQQEDVEIKPNQIESKLEKIKSQLIVVTENNIEKYSLLDVIMPIPGFRVPYPENDALKEIYCDVLKKDGIEGGFASLKNKVDTFSLPGDFRKIVNKPKDLTWRFIRHDDLNEDILVNDADIIEGKSYKEDNESGELKSLIVEMSLNSSTYATIALREALKIDLSKGSQSELTEKFKFLVEEKKRKNEEVENNPEDEPEIKKMKTENGNQQI